LNQIGHLELIADRVVEGFVSGKHPSPFKGGCVEFADHRSYTPGDEVRLVDWRAFARSDRYYIKQFEEETNLQVMLVVDGSGSMDFGLSTVPKVRYAQMTAACLARLMLHQRDSVGLSVIDSGIRSYVPPRSKASHFRVILSELSRIHPEGETSLATVLHEIAERIRRRGMVIICSDCFDDIEPLSNALYHFRSRGHETILFHIMAPEEITFDFTRWSRFECLEVAGRRMDLDPVAVRDRYVERVNGFLDGLKEACGESECDYVPLRTDRPLGDALSYYLALRKARAR
jgi:uncharacterized protein (DUF58 family)